MPPRVLQIPARLSAAGTSHGEFETIATLDGIPESGMLRVTLGDLDLLIARTPAGICVTDDRCPHMSAPLSLGSLEDCVVACPLHRGRFDLSTGETVQFPTTGGIAADGEYHAPWTPSDSAPKPEPTDLKAQARANTRVRRLRYYPARLNGDQIQVCLPR